jgi:PAS domain S-box-containing protein
VDARPVFTGPTPKWNETSLRALLDAAPDALLMTNQQGEIVFANGQAGRLYGYSQEELIGKSVESLIRTNLREQHRIHREHLFADPQARPMGVGFQIFALRGDGSEILADVNLSPVVTESGTFVVSSIRDTTDRWFEHELEKSAGILRGIRESEERFRLMADFAPVMIWISGTDKLCTYFNKSWLEFTGRSLDQEIGNGWAEGVYPDDLQRCVDGYTQAFNRQEKFILEYRLRRFDGQYRWILDTGAPRFRGDQSFAGFIGCGVDIHDRVLAEEVLSTVNRKLIEAQEQERIRIARELHDDFSQRVALVGVELDQVKQMLAGSADELHHRIDGLKGRISEISSDFRSLARQLHSSKLEYLGLVSAIRDFCTELAKKHDVEIEFANQGIPSALAADVSLCLFRVVQEALTNAVKHSAVRQFEVNLQGSPEEISLTVRDAGVGFDPESRNLTQGLGLVSMRERVNLVNGAFSIKAKPQRGTEINVRVPLSDTARKKSVAV